MYVLKITNVAITNKCAKLMDLCNQHISYCMSNCELCIKIFKMFKKLQMQKCRKKENPEKLKVDKKKLKFV